MRPTSSPGSWARSSTAEEPATVNRPRPRGRGPGGNSGRPGFARRSASLREDAMVCASVIEGARPGAPPLPRFEETTMRSPRTTLVLGLAALLAIAGCSEDDPSGPGGGGQPVGETNEFFGRMPAWDDYANNGPDELPTADGETVELGSTEVEVEEIQEDGTVAPPE